jgi:hypothetical protein
MYPIPKIELKVSITELQQAIEGTKCFDHYLPNQRIVKAARASLFRTVVKLTKKELTKRDAKKPFNLKLEYDEAHFLEEFLRIRNQIEPNHFQKTFADKLHQKLA